MNIVDLPPTLPDLDTLIDTAVATAGETNRFDFKEVLDLAKDEHKLRLVRAVGAFGNTDEGGFVLIGISDDRRVVGLDDAIADQYDQTRVCAVIAQYLVPPPVFRARQHIRDGKRLVVLEVEAFSEIPSVVRQSATFGKERLYAGTFLSRTTGAESGAIVSEAALRALFDAAVKRRASLFVELFQRGTVNRAHSDHPGAFASLIDLRSRLDQDWPRGDSSPYFEVAFSPREALAVSGRALDEAVRVASIEIQHRFPFLDVGAGPVGGVTPWGSYGRIPFADWGTSEPRPSYLWAASRDGAFADREGYWEDKPGSAIPGGVGIYHVVGQIILLVRFADRFFAALKSPPESEVRLALRLTGTTGRYLDDEHRGYPSPVSPKCKSAQIEAHVEVQVAQLARQQMEIGLALAEEVAWQFDRRSWTRHHLEQFFNRAKDLLGKPYDLRIATTGHVR
jgi:hypothetical protein